MKEKLFEIYEEITGMKNNNVHISQRAIHFNGRLNAIENEIKEKHSLGILNDKEIKDLNGLIKGLCEVCSQEYSYNK